MAKKAKKGGESEAADLTAKLAAMRARPKKTSFESWSFSRYSDYKRCPLAAKLKHLDKVEEPPNDAMERGAAIGRLAELYVKGEVKKMPAELSKFADVFAEMRALYAKHPQRMVVEDTWAMRKDWSPTVWNDWAGCAVRVKIDCGHMASKKKMIVRDWKTGKYRVEKVEEYVEQLELYALAAFQMTEELQEVEAFLCFLDAGVTYPPPDEAERLTFARADVPRLKKTWDKRTRAMLLDRAFAPRPNRGCQWCHYRKANAPAMPGKKALCRY